MSNSGKVDQSSRDTSPLKLEQLSDSELSHILEIEDRIAESLEIDYKVPPRNKSNRQPLPSHDYLAQVETRYRRVLLLDGGRGTGKTSLLLTLVKKWHGDAEIERERWADKDQFEARVNNLRNSCPKAPAYIRVIRILEFDPLPPGMPILAGIIEALRPLAERYDPQPQYGETTCEDDQETLLDKWHRLFRVAAVGWSEIPNRNGLVEQLLDREEQVKDWQSIADDWQSFIEDVLKRGKSAPGSSRLPPETVFVIMIDDVDLQIGRVQELLPALRLLYHPRVFFLVAADQVHMIGMLQLDIFGRQNKLAHSRNSRSGDINRLASADRWAPDLAESAFQKVFATRNQWKVKRLSCREFLAFPGIPDGSVEEADGSSRARNFLTDLKIISSEDPTIKETAGDFISRFARDAEVFKLPGVMTYRSAEQLRQSVTGLAELDSIKVLTRLLSQGTGEGSAVVRGDGSGVDVGITGVLSALYRPGPPDFCGPYSIVLSARPDFIFHKPLEPSAVRMSTQADNRFNFTVALMAKMLEESYFHVDAASLGWETSLSLAWTEWRSLQLSFAWERYMHPRPDQLLEQTKAWAQSIKDVVKRESRREDRRTERLERYAYAWIYHQSKFSDDTKPTSPDTPGEVSPPSSGELSWEALLQSVDTNQNKPEVWRRNTLPLLARPELGFPPDVQARLLNDLPADVCVLLGNERRRLVTDAYLASGMQRDEVLKLPTPGQVEEWITTIDQTFAEQYGGTNYWKSIIEKHRKSTKRRAAGAPI